MLIGCHTLSGAPQPITEGAVRVMSRHTGRPVIFALSSPTAELTAAQAYHWSDGQAIFANFEGSADEVAAPDGRILSPSKVQSVYTFPGVTLATCITRYTLLTSSSIQLHSSCFAQLHTSRTAFLAACALSLLCILDRSGTQTRDSHSQRCHGMQGADNQGVPVDRGCQIDSCHAG